MVTDIVLKSLIQSLQIFEFHGQCASFICAGDQLIHVLYADAILHEFRNCTFHLMNIALLMQETSHGRQLLLQVSCDLLQHQAFAGVIQYRHFLRSYFLQDTMAESAEA